MERGCDPTEAELQRRRLLGQFLPSHVDRVAAEPRARCAAEEEEGEEEKEEEEEEGAKDWKSHVSGRGRIGEHMQALHCTTPLGKLHGCRTESCE